jgi:hypothetical protein
MLQHKDINEWNLGVRSAVWCCTACRCKVRRNWDRGLAPAFFSTCSPNTGVQYVHYKRTEEGRGTPCDCYGAFDKPKVGDHTSRKEDTAEISLGENVTPSRFLPTYSTFRSICQHSSIFKKAITKHIVQSAIQIPEPPSLSLSLSLSLSHTHTQHPITFCHSALPACTGLQQWWTLFKSELSVINTLTSWQTLNCLQDW